jgi:hypothetical protein
MASVVWLLFDRCAYLKLAVQDKWLVSHVVGTGLRGLGSAGSAFIGPEILRFAQNDSFVLVGA